MSKLISVYKWVFHDQGRKAAVAAILVAVGMAIGGKESWASVVPVVVAALAQLSKK